MCRISSGNLHHRRIVARSTGLFGLSGGSGKTSSKYEQITLDSTLVLPSCTSTVTSARGFIFFNSAVSCSPLPLLTLLLVHGTSFSSGTTRTFSAHTDRLL